MSRRLALLGGAGVALVAAAALVWLVLGKAPGRGGALSGPDPAGAATRATAGASTGPRVPPPPGPVFDPRTVPLTPSQPSPATGALAVGLYGTVVDAESRKPLPRARVAARPRGGGAVRGVETDAAGRFAVRGIPPGAYEVMAVAEGFLLGAPAVVEAALATAAAQVEVGLERGLDVAGRVVDPARRPASGVTVEIVGAPADRYVGAFAPVQSDAQGAFRLPGVPPGEGLKLVARGAGYSETEVALPAVVAPQGLSGLEVVLRRFRITGRAVPGPGAALPPAGLGVTVEVSTLAMGDEAPSVPAAKVPLGADGRFEALVPHPGSYAVRAAPGGLPRPAGAPAEDAVASATVRVEVGADGSAPEVTLVLERLRVLEGRTADKAGKPLASTRVRVREDAGKAILGEALTDAEGRFRFPLLPRSYRLSARRAGFAPASLSGVEPGGAPVQVTLEPQEGAVAASGKLRGLDGKPLAGVVVHLEPGDDPEEALDARVDKDGALEISSLAPGTYVQSFVEAASSTELRAWSRKLRVEPGHPADLGFEENEARGRIQGVVRGAPRGAAISVNLQPAAEAEGRFGFLAAVAADAEGVFDFGAVPPGRYDLRAASDAAGATASVEVSSGGTARVEMLLEASGGRR